MYIYIFIYAYVIPMCSKYGGMDGSMVEWMDG